MSLNSEGVYTLNTKTCMTEIMTNHRNSMRYYDWLFSMDLTNLKKISIPFSQFIVSQLCSFTYVFIDSLQRGNFNWSKLPHMDDTVCRSRADWLIPRLEEDRECQSSAGMGEAQNTVDTIWFHFSSMQVITWLVCTVGWWTNNSTSKSSPQTGSPVFT